MNYRKLKLTIILLLATLSAMDVTVSVAGAESSAKAAPEQRQRKKSSAAAEPSRDYSRFTHQVLQHKGLACDACHKFPTANWKSVRKADAFEDVTDYPQHAACLQCHRQQFFSGAVPSICRVCHTDPSPRNSTRFPFPNPRALFDASPKGQTKTSEYAVYFPHDKHEAVLGEAHPAVEPEHGARLVAVAFHQDKAKDTQAKDSQAARGYCVQCHQTYQPQGDSDDEYVTKAPKNLPDTAFWLKKGTFKTAPQGHERCFTCHSADMKPAAIDCGICHKLLTPEQAAARKAAHGDFDPKTAATMGITDKTALAKWGRREAVRFRHEWFSHAELSCASCHATAALNTLNEKGPSVPVLSCGGSGSGCHITKTTDDGGALNAEADQKQTAATFQCTKCHAQLGKQPIPPSHLKAIAAIKDKP